MKLPDRRYLVGLAAALALVAASTAVTVTDGEPAGHAIAPAPDPTPPSPSPAGDVDVLTLALQRPELTPGQYYSDKPFDDICSMNGNTITSFPLDQARGIFTRYGQGFPAAADAGDWQVDELIPLNLGGTTDPSNMWPQQQPGAGLKNILEGVLHVKVCSGQVPLAVAQQEIAADWRQAYVKYVEAPAGDTIRD